jgi:hypothetical protein
LPKVATSSTGMIDNHPAFFNGRTEFERSDPGRNYCIEGGKVRENSEKTRIKNVLT